MSYDRERRDQTAAEARAMWTSHDGPLTTITENELRAIRRLFHGVALADGYSWGEPTGVLIDEITDTLFQRLGAAMVGDTPRELAAVHERVTSGEREQPQGGA